MLEANDVTKDFKPPFSLRKPAMLGFRPGRTVRALDNVSFSLPKGSILAILGPNGAGKTTLLKIIAGLILPDNGSIVIDGLLPGMDDNRIKSLIGLSSLQEKGFYWRLTGRQNLEFFAAMYGLTPAGTRKKIAELFDILNIDYGDRRFDSYSAGMKQKLSIARSLIHDPMLLLLDEPTKSLDYTTSTKLMALLGGEIVKKQGKTVIFTTHHMDEAAHSAKLYMVLSGGKALAFGTLNEVREQAGIPSASIGDVFLRLIKAAGYA
jgi:ABC-2 type transport system ATP-binding protein